MMAFLMMSRTLRLMAVIVIFLIFINLCWNLAIFNVSGHINIRVSDANTAERPNFATTSIQRSVNGRKRNYTHIVEKLNSKIPLDPLSFQEQHATVLGVKSFETMDLKELKKHLFRSKRCPAYDRWRYSPNRDQFERDSQTARTSFDNLNFARIVHFIADNETWQFIFLNYLVVLSAIRFIQPHSVYIHLIVEPEADDNHYLEWWEEILDSIPHLIIVKYSSSPEAILRDYGGFFVPWDVLIFEELNDRLEAASNDGFNSGAISYMAENEAKIKHLRFVEGIFKYDETLVPNGQISRTMGTNQIHPANFFTGDDQFSANVRALMYASRSKIVAKNDPSTQIPLLCHYILIGGNDLKLETFISMLSCLAILGADVAVHGNEEPHGKKWSTLIALYGDRVQFINSDYPAMAYGNTAGTIVAASDIWRVEILLRYGGIYVDWDAIWLKPLAPELLTHEAVISRDIYIPKGFPDSFNNGILLAKKNAEFLHRYQESLRYHRTSCSLPKLCGKDGPLTETLALYNSLFSSYKVYECYPWTVLVEPHLQVMCYHENCITMWPRNSSDPIDWTDTYSQHFSTDPFEYSNQEILASELEKMKKGGSVSFVVSNAAKVFEKAHFSIAQLRALG